MTAAQTELFPPIEPYESGFLAVDETHALYWEQSGNPNGVPVLFLHGGPGGGTKPAHRQFFDPKFYRIILFDQRGAGKSTPHAECRNNTTAHLIADIEMLRHHLKIKQWLVFGGSWGSTLAIAYGEAHPESCLGFILRGIFLVRPFEIDWFTYGARHVFSEAWEKFSNHIPAAERNNLMLAYYHRVNDPDPNIHLPAAKIYSQYEGEISALYPNKELVDSFGEEKTALSIARIETHYFVNNFNELGDQLLKNIPKIAHLPCTIVQGRYDMCCPAISAYDLAKSWPGAELIMVPDAGHSAFEPGILNELLNATEKFKKSP